MEVGYWRTRTRELVHDEDYSTRVAARTGIFEYLETFYIRVRLHSSLGFLAPAEFERGYHLNHP